MTEKRFRFYQDIHETIFIEDLEGEDIRLANEEDMSVDEALKLVDLLNKFNERLDWYKRELNRVCSCNEELGDKLEKIGRIL